MSLKQKKVKDLKEMCKEKKISGYSKLKKENLIKILNKKGGNFNPIINTGLNKNNINNIYEKNYFIAHKEDNDNLFNYLSNLTKENRNKK
jgi:hypothetical protein